jgi:hypothetical protein
MTKMGGDLGWTWDFAKYWLDGRKRPSKFEDLLNHRGYQIINEG